MLGGAVPELAAVHVVDGAELIGDGREHPRVSVPEGHREWPGGGVDVVEARLVEDPRALRGHGHGQRPDRRRDQRGRRGPGRRGPGRGRRTARRRGRGCWRTGRRRASWRSLAKPRLAEQLRQAVALAGQQPELDGHRLGVVIHGERRVAEGVAHLGGVPELLVPGPPFGDRRISLALADRVRHVDVADPDHPHREGLDDADRLPRGVDHHITVTGTGQRLALVLVVGEQPRRGRLRAVEYRGHQQIAQRPGKPEFHDAKPSSFHAAKPSDFPAVTTVMHGTGGMSAGPVTFRPMSARWSTDSVLSLASDDSSRRAAATLARPVPWNDTGTAGDLVWGLCAGSGKNPYQVIVDLAGPAYKCSCPSRKFPCKHALGLLLLWSDGCVPDAVQADSPGYARTWLESRQERAQRPTPASRTDSAAPAAPGDSQGVAGQKAVAAARRAAERAQRVSDGLADLREWLRDQVRAGLAGSGMPGGGAGAANLMATRMVDAQAPGVAGALRTLPAAASDGPSRLLAEYALLHLLIRAHERLGQLPEDLAATVRSRVGYPVRAEEVLARPAVADRWLVLATRELTDAAVPGRRIWLRGRATNRWAMLLTFADPNGTWQDPATARLRPGTEITAGLHYYPGRPTTARGRRRAARRSCPDRTDAARGRRSRPAGPVGGRSGTRPVAHHLACAAYRDPGAVPRRAALAASRQCRPPTPAGGPRLTVDAARGLRRPPGHGGGRMASRRPRRADDLARRTGGAAMSERAGKHSEPVSEPASSARPRMRTPSASEVAS